MRHARRFTHSVPAESLIETIVSITIIVIGAAAALSMLRSSFTGNELVGTKEIAIQLALEGLDAFKNTRDTNYLLFAGDADDCWNTLGLSDAADCTSASSSDEILTEGETYYFARYWAGGAAPGWDIFPVSRTNDGYEDLYSVDLDSDGTEDVELYAQTGISDSRFSVLESHAFFRTASIVYSATGDSYDATVTVTWREHGNTHSVQFTRTLAHVY